MRGRDVVKVVVMGGVGLGIGGCGDNATQRTVSVPVRTAPGAAHSQRAFSITIPTGWKDVSGNPPAGVRALASAGTSFDGYYVNGHGRSLVTVVVAHEYVPRLIPVEVAVAKQIAGIRRGFARLGPMLTHPRATRLGGVGAETFDLRYTVAGANITQRYVVAKFRLAGYTVIYSAASQQGFDRSRPSFDGLLRTWTWTTA